MRSSTDRDECVGGATRDDDDVSHARKEGRKGKKGEKKSITPLKSDESGIHITELVPKGGGGWNGAEQG